MKYLLILLLFWGCKKEDPKPTYKIVNIEAKGNLFIDNVYKYRPYSAQLEVGKTYNIKVKNSQYFSVYLRIIIEGNQVYYEQNLNEYYYILNIEYNLTVK